MRPIKLTAILLLAGGTQLLGGAQLYAQPPDIDAAAAAKADAGREAQSSHPLTQAPGPRAAGTFTTFDVPGAGTGFGQGTFPTSINEAGEIAGSYVDANYTQHSFVRARSGALTTFDVPGGTSTEGSSINSPGSVTGSYVYLDDPNSLSHGYLRTGNGRFTTFDAPGAALIDTFPKAINPAGTVTGTYWDGVTGQPDGSTTCVFRGFLRARDGDITGFDAPGANTTPSVCFTFGPWNGTQAVGINPEGVILGIYDDTNGNKHGYLRRVDGTFTSFDPPGQISLVSPYSFGTNLQMNSAGVITGSYFQPLSNPFGGNYRVFVRAPDDTFTTFDAVPYPNGNPSLNIYCCTWSFPTGINPSGEIVGSFNDAFGINHGFLRTRDGTVTTFDVPGAGTRGTQGTGPLGITPSGLIMGIYIDPNYVRHGFLFAPRQW